MNNKISLVQCVSCSEGNVRSGTAVLGETVELTFFLFFFLQMGKIRPRRLAVLTWGTARKGRLDPNTKEESGLTSTLPAEHSDCKASKAGGTGRAPASGGTRRRAAGSRRESETRAVRDAAWERLSCACAEALLRDFILRPKLESRVDVGPSGSLYK